jgi:hypothetical protein
MTPAAPAVADPVNEEWILTYIPRGKRGTDFKCFKRKMTKREAISFCRTLCDRFGVRFIHVEELFANIEEVIKNQNQFF